MAVNLSPVGGVAAQFFTNTGAVLTGGKLYTYLAGTTTPTPTYTTSAGNVARTNPIVLDAAGRVPSSGEIWLTVGIIYKFVLTDSNDVLIGTYDNVSSALNTDASLVTYTPAGTGAVTTTVQAKLRQYVSVLDFGANSIPGTTDMSSAAQAAINYVGAAGGGVVYFPQGIYKIATTLTVSYNGVELLGAGSLNTTTYLVGNTATPAQIITLTGTNFTLRNIAIGGAPKGVAVPNATLITELLFSNVSFNDISNTCFFHADTTDGTGGLITGRFENIFFNTCQNGFYFNDGCLINDTDFNSLHFYNPLNDGYGIFFGDSSYTQNNSVRDTLYNFVPNSNSIFISIGKQQGPITIDNCFSADLTWSSGVNDNFPIIQIRPNASTLDQFAITNCAFINPRGPVIDLSSTSVGSLLLSNNSFDNGSGLAAEVIKNFDKFYSVNMVNNRFVSTIATAIPLRLSGGGNLGTGLPANAPALIGSWPVAVSVDTVLTSSNNNAVVFVTTGATNKSITLPSANFAVGTTIKVNKQDSGVGNVVVNRSSSDTVGGAGIFSYTITTQYTTATFVSDGTSNWYVQI